MSDEELVQKIGKMIIANNKTVVSTVTKQVTQQVTQQIDIKIRESEERTWQVIKAAQEDTIEVLTELINTGYNLHEERIQRLEDKVGLPPLGQEH